MTYRDYDFDLFDVDEVQLKIIGGALAGLLVGGLIGAAAMMLYAPQIGTRTRKLIRKRAMALRHKVAETAEEARERAEDKLDEALERARDTKDEVRDRVEHIQKRGQKSFDEQKERVVAAVESGRQAIRRR